MKDPLGIPESLFMLCDSIVAFDHLFQTLYIISHIYLPSTSSGYSISEKYDQASRAIEEIAARLTADHIPLPKQPAIPKEKPESVSNIGKKGYEAHVTKMREHIVKGDIIQAVPSQRIARPTALHPFNAYRYLRQVNPSPYMFYLDCGDSLAFVGASPECLVKVSKGIVTNHAIAGTIKRGATEEGAC